MKKLIHGSQLVTYSFIQTLIHEVRLKDDSVEWRACCDELSDLFAQKVRESNEKNST